MKQQLQKNGSAQGGRLLSIAHRSHQVGLSVECDRECKILKSQWRNPTSECVCVFVIYILHLLYLVRACVSFSLSLSMCMCVCEYVHLLWVWCRYSCCCCLLLQWVRNKRSLNFVPSFEFHAKHERASERPTNRELSITKQHSTPQNQAKKKFANARMAFIQSTTARLTERYDGYERVESFSRCNTCSHAPRVLVLLLLSFLLNRRYLTECAA